MRVVNDDIVAPKKGFDPHPHDNMEIIGYVRKGAITIKTIWARGQNRSRRCPSNVCWNRSCPLRI